MPIKKIFFFTLLIAGFLGFSHYSHAVCCCGTIPATPINGDCSGECGGKDTKGNSLNFVKVDGDSCVKKSNDSGSGSGGGGVQLENWLPLPKEAAGQEIQYLIGRVIKVIMGLVGSIALLMFAYGGLLWMTAAGNEEKIEDGKNIFIWATAGILVIFTSYILVYFVISNLLTLGK